MTQSDFLPALKPAYPDLKSCDAWLATAALGDSRHACVAFLSLLDEIEEAPPPRKTYAQLLEHLLPRLLAAISEQTRRFVAKPMPLSPAEAQAFTQVCDLWLALLRAYRKLLRAAVDATPAETDVALALLAARSTTCASELIAVHLLARREPGVDLWQWLHVNYAFAEARGLAGIAPDGGQGNDCATTYAQAMLFALARPQSLTQRDMFWTRAWVRRFAHKVRIARSTAQDSAYAIDLGGGSAPAWRNAADAARNLSGQSGHDNPVRFLDMDALRHSLRNRLRRLEAGEEPAALGLGQNCTSPGAGALLRRLLLTWCAAPASPRFPRRPVTARHAAARVAMGFPNAHAAVSGKPFCSEARSWDYSRRDADQIHIFQRSFGPQDRLQAADLRQEQWLALDESACGFRLQRQGPGVRIAHRQLIALQAGGAPRFMLGEVRWLMQDAEERLELGVQMLPGLALACALRPYSEDPANTQAFSPALLLPTVQGAAPSLILAAGWYQRDRLLELRLEENIMRIRLSSLIDRGFDYDRVNFGAEA